MPFFQNYSKPGPGISKNLPPKKGLDLFFSVLWRELSNLVKLNLLFVLFSIPIVTIGPAYAAMTRITTKMIWDRNIFLMHEFLGEFKKDLKRTIPTGIVTTILFFVLSYAVQFYGYQAGENTVFMIIFVVTMFICLLLSLAFVYLYPLMVNVHLDMKDVVHNAFILGIVCIKHSLPCILIFGLIFFLVYLFFPLSVIVSFFITFSLFSLINSFAAWAGINKYVVRENQALEGQGETEK